MRATFILFLFFGVLTKSVGQNVLSRSLEYYKAGKLNEAKLVIDSAMRLPEYQQLPTTWYLQGFIYKDLYKADDTRTAYRDKAIESFIRLGQLDKDKRFTKESSQNVRFLAATYYNEGIRFIEAGRFDDAVASYEKFEKVAIAANDSVLRNPESKAKFYLVLGSGIMKYGRENKQEKLTSAKAIECFEKVLAIDSGSREANYNIAVIYYNDAVNRILSLDYDAVNFEDYSKFEDAIIELFHKSLPYMTRAYRMDPNDLGVIEGLAGIYFGLRDFDASNKYKQELAVASKR